MESQTIEVRDELKANKLKARAANTFIRSTGLFSWLVFQVPFAIISIVFFGLASAFSAAETANQINDDDALLNKAFKYVGNAVIDMAGWTAEQIANYFEFSLSSLEPANLFFISYLLVFLFGIITLLGIYIIYKVAGLNPIIGDRGGATKFLMFMLTFIGYSIPFFNLLPWFYLWTISVQKYPT